MPKTAAAKAKKKKNGKRPIQPYEHPGKQRINNPPVGLVTPQTDPDLPTHKSYDYIQPVPSLRQPLDYDPHLPPQLVWAGKREHSSFEVHTASLHVHERIDPRTIVEAVRRRNGNGLPQQPSLFERGEENPPLYEAIDFYRHPHGWSNRLIAGDSLLIMNSLLEKEGMAGQVQMVYIDPPYGKTYNSNFQPFVNKRDVKDGRDEDLTAEPEMIRAFRDTWEFGIHSYLTYLRDRLLLVQDLLHSSGSCFVQIGDENVHLVRNLMDELFGAENFVSTINFQSMTPLESGNIENVFDYLLWYAKDKEKLKYRNIFIAKPLESDGEFKFIDADGGTYRELSQEERLQLADHPRLAHIFKRSVLESSGFTKSCTFTFGFQNRQFNPRGGKSWRTNLEGMKTLNQKNRLFILGSKLYYKLYYNDFPFMSLTNGWMDTMAGYAEPKRYVVQTHPKIIQRCLLMTTDPGDLVLDPTCGSGTTAFVAEEWGRRWITCDTSRVATTIAKQRLMTAMYDYYELALPQEGVGSGFRYETVPHVTLKSVANNEPPTPETLYDRPQKDKSKVRVTGPFTVEAVPAPTVRALDEITAPPMPADNSVARSGPTYRHAQWRDELLKTGLRGKGGHHIDFSRVEPLAGTRWLHADAETKGTKPERVVISFGPEHGPLDPNQVELAWDEARTLSPRPSILVFAAFQFDPEAAKDVDSLTKDKTGMTFLTAQMNADLLTEDLKKKRTSNQGFWLVGRPDVELCQLKSGEHKGNWQVEVRGFDYYDTRTGTIESGDTSRIAMWLFDPDYDGRSLYPRQVFFPIAADDGGWARLAKNLKAEIGPDLIEAYRGTVSLPFEPGPHQQVAVKVIDDRGIESVKVLALK